MTVGVKRQRSDGMSKLCLRENAEGHNPSDDGGNQSQCWITLLVSVLLAATLLLANCASLPLDFGPRLHCLFWSLATCVPPEAQLKRF